MTGTSDQYEHAFHRHTPDQYDNLVALARYQVTQGAGKDARGGLCFDDLGKSGSLPPPCAVAGVATRLPPLACGPLAGAAALPGEGWRENCGRALDIGIAAPDAFCLWLQSPLRQRTEPSARGAGRVAAAKPGTRPGPVQRRGRLSDRELMPGALLVGAATSLVYWLTV